MDLIQRPTGAQGLQRLERVAVSALLKTAFSVGCGNGNGCDPVRQNLRRGVRVSRCHKPIGWQGHLFAKRHEVICQTTRGHLPSDTRSFAKRHGLFAERYQEEHDRPQGKASDAEQVEPRRELLFRGGRYLLFLPLRMLDLQLGFDFLFPVPLETQLFEPSLQGSDFRCGRCGGGLPCG